MFGIILAIIACGFIIFWLYHKRQVATLKHVLDNHRVHYMPDSSIDGRHHFDNPVYSMGNPPMRNDSFTTKLNNAQIKNNLNKESNLDKQKLAVNSTYGDEESWMYGGK